MKICKYFNIKPCLYCEENVFDKATFCEITHDIILIDHWIKHCDSETVERSIIKGYKFRMDNECEIAWYMCALEQVSHEHYLWLSKISILM